MSAMASRGRGRPAFTWRAMLWNRRFPGSLTTGGYLVPKGTVTLRMVLDGAGVHTGREVDVVIRPEDLDVVFHLVDRARKVRDKK